MTKPETTQDTHQAIDHQLCGQVREIDSDRSIVELLLLEQMRADATGLVHGGFIVGAADDAAMLAVNDPNAVFDATEVRLMRPSQVRATCFSAPEFVRPSLDRKASPRQSTLIPLNRYK